MQLIIGNQNYSSWSLRPWVLLKHFNIPFDVHKIQLFSDDMAKQMAPFCPNNKVPVLIENDVKIWDSLAICEYINEQYLAKKAWPENMLERAKARAICAEMHSSFNALRNEMPMNCRRKPDEITLSENCQNDISRIISIWQDCLANNKKGFLFGEFSIADAFYLPVVSRFHSYQIAVPSDVKQYIQNMLELPSYKEWLAQSKQEAEVINYSEV